MPRPKKNYTNKTKDTTINSTIVDMDSKTMSNNHIKLVMWKAEVKDRMKDAIRKLNDMQKEKLAMFELEFQNALMGIPINILKTPIDIQNEKFRSFILGIEEDNLIETSPNSPSYEPTTTVKRRSRSASSAKYSTRARINRVRSTSVDIYKTPKGRVKLSTIMSSKKYTVVKPKKILNSGVHVKRIMKPDEEAISTSGSPLHVASGCLYAPHVNIPLPGGVVLNIEPKSPKGPLEIPGLDAKTRNQIKLLCEQLKKLC